MRTKVYITHNVQRLTWVRKVGDRKQNETYDDLDGDQDEEIEKYMS